MGRRDAARGVLSWEGMNAIFFGLKRAHHSVLRLTRRPLALMGLTAARFDMLYAIDGFMTQSKLGKVLGVTRATVSRMVRSLELLGWVRRKAIYGDRRQRSVRLTKRGKRLIRVAFYRFVHRGAAQLAVDSAITYGQFYDEDACFDAMSQLDSSLRAIREAYGDSATLYYLWHPEDWIAEPEWLWDYGDWDYGDWDYGDWDYGD